MEKATAHLIVSGRVQGVCYRMHTEEEALRRGLSGWVRNLPTGQVEALFEGNKEAIEDMVRWCRQGPPAARVKSVEIEWQAYRGDCPGFKIAKY